jgi:putative ABC transport system permease protein
VEGAALVGAMPFADRPDFFPFLLEGRPLEDAVSASDVAATHVSPEYFDVMGIPFLRGRGFGPGDHAGTPTVAVMSRAAGERLLPGQDPLGKRFYYTEALDVATVVGLVDDVLHSARQEADPLVYFSYAQNPGHFTSLVVRSGGDPRTLAGPVQEAIWAVDPDQPVWEVMTMRERMASSMVSERFVMQVLGAFAASALFLAALGIYGVMSQAVSRQSREIGVRLALGASPRRVLGSVMGPGLAMVAMGTALGLAAATVLTGTLEAMLFGVQPLDPATFVAAPLVVGWVALAACLVPAWRATRVDPAQSLHEG